MEARAGNSIFDFETLFSDFQELLNGSGLNSIKCVVNWIPLRIHVRSRNAQPHLKKGKVHEADYKKAARAKRQHINHKQIGLLVAFYRDVYLPACTRVEDHLYDQTAVNVSEFEGRRYVCASCSV